MDLLSMSKMGAILIMVIASLRLCLKNRLPRKAFLALWLLAILRLCIPFTLPSPVSIYNFTSQFSSETTGVMPAQLVPSDNLLSGAMIENAANQEAPTAPYSPLFTLWLIGACATLFFFFIMHLLARREYSDSLPAKFPGFSDWMKEHSLYRKLQIRVSDRILAPLTYGILRPVIVLPKTIVRHQSVQLPFVLEHEYYHIRRLDVLWKYILLITLCIHWFNPAVWLMFYLANRDLELSCDEAVIKKFGMRHRYDYAMALLALEDARSHLTPLCNHFSNSAMKERIQSIMKRKNIGISISLLAILLIIGIGAAFATSPYKHAEFTISDMLSLSHTWADSLKTRDGKPRFEIMTKEMQEKFLKEKADQGLPNTYNIGVSSPWVVDYKVALGARDDAWITYYTTTSDQDCYIVQEHITFTKENGQPRVASAAETTSYLEESLFYKAQDIQSKVDRGEESWRLEPEKVAREFLRKQFGESMGSFIVPWNENTQSLTYQQPSGVQIKLRLYHPYGASDHPFWAIATYQIGETTTDITMTSLEP